MIKGIRVTVEDFETDAGALRAGISAVKALIDDVRACYPEGLDELDEIKALIEPIEVWLASLSEEMKRTSDAKEAPVVRVVEDDEIVVAPLFHMERMSADHIWFRIGAAAFDLEIVGRKRLRWMAQADVDEWTPDMLGLDLR